MPIIPFYGADDPELFAIERRTMDRPGIVIGAVGDVMPAVTACLAIPVVVISLPALQGAWNSLVCLLLGQAIRGLH